MIRTLQHLVNMNEQYSELRIILVGKTGAGKSATGNTILGGERFHKAASTTSVTKQCQLESSVVDAIKVTVVDTPGWCDTEFSEAELVEETMNCIKMSFPGPHVFLLVLRVDRFTDEEKHTVKKIQEIFGDCANSYMMILFTRKDDLEQESTSIESYLNTAHNDLKDLVSRCNGRYHVFNNRVKDHRQVTELLQKIQAMVFANGGGCYTNTTYQLLKDYKRLEAELEENKKEMQSRDAEHERRISALEQRIEFREAEKPSPGETKFSVLAMVSFLEQVQLNENKQKALTAQAARQKQILDLERQKLKDEQIKLQHQAQDEEKRRKELEREGARYKKDMTDMETNYKKEIEKLEEENRRVKEERDEKLRTELKKKQCNIS